MNLMTPVAEKGVFIQKKEKEEKKRKEKEHHISGLSGTALPDVSPPESRPQHDTSQIEEQSIHFRHSQQEDSKGS